jgi:2-dehydro-3-deoxygalactonokinase
VTRPFIALDWGTTSFRAYHVDGQGKVINEFADAEGILAVKDGAFEAVLESHIGSWDKLLPVVASGMITSRQGWIERPYVDCPASAADLAKAIHLHKTSSGRLIHFITGLHLKSPSIGHDVMRSEEVQVFGSLDTGAHHFVTPGTHSKWIDVEEGRITNFATYITGETFSLMRNHSILGRLMKDDADDEAAFNQGVEKAFADPAGLLHSLFSVRSLGLFDALKPEQLSSYLSGIVIGTEVAHAKLSNDRSAKYVVLASPNIGMRYLRAMKIAGLDVDYGDPLSIVKGEALIAKQAGII